MSVPNEESSGSQRGSPCFSLVRMERRVVSFQAILGGAAA